MNNMPQNRIHFNRGVSLGYTAPLPMKFIFSLLAAWLVVVAGSRAQTELQFIPSQTVDTNSLPTSAQRASIYNEVAPLIHLEDTPLPDAVRYLAQQAGINIQLDSHIATAPQVTADGHTQTVQSVSFRWENLTAAQALDAVLEGAGWQLIMNPSTKVGRIAIKEANAVEPMATAVVPISYASPTNLAIILTKALPDGAKVIADPRSGKVLVTARQNELPRIVEYIHAIDTAEHQVLIEARFIETTASPTSVKGVDWSGTLNAQNITLGNGLTGSSTSNTRPGTPVTTTTTTPGGRTITSTTSPDVTTAGVSTTTLVPTSPGSVQNVPGPGMSLSTVGSLIPATAFLNADGVAAVLSFLNTEADTESLATPRAVAMDNVPTELSVIRNIPVFEQQQGVASGGTVQGNTVRPNYLLKGPVGPNGQLTTLNEVGIKLLVTPRVVGETNVMMELQPEISAEEAQPATTTLGGQISTAPIFSRRRLTTSAIVPSGNTLVLGGLINDNANNSYTKVPILGDLPGIGYLFRHDSKALQKDNLLIFVTPTIIETRDFQSNHDGRKFLKSKPIVTMEREPGPLDAGKPMDWTQPK
jgi:type IV pilus assembly protein PilQ